jgi:hypothetical protein
VVERCKRTGQVRTHFGTRRQFQWEENVVEKENAGKEGQGKQQLQQQKGSVTAAERAMERRCVNFVIQVYTLCFGNAAKTCLNCLRASTTLIVQTCW